MNILILLLFTPSLSLIHHQYNFNPAKPSRESQRYIYNSNHLYNNNNNNYNNNNYNNNKNNNNKSNNDEDDLLSIPPFNNKETLAISQSPEDYCEGSEFIADCSSQDAVVVILTAKYGRMKSRCNDESTMDAGCHQDVLEWMELWCSGRKKCKVSVTRIVDKLKSKECLKLVRGFLRSSYMCLPVVTRAPKVCTSSSSSSSSSSLSSSSSSSSLSDIQITQPYSFLANTVTTESGCGSMKEPWILHANKGQTIIITMFDFTTALMKNNFNRNSCRVFAMIQESHTPSQTICGGERKVSTVFMSQGNSITIQTVAVKSSSSLSSSSSHENDNTPFFLLKFSVAGCSDIEEKNGMVVERMGGVSLVHCIDGGAKVQLYCNDSVWKGKLPDCIAWNASSSSDFFSSFWNLFSNSQWVAVATILSIALFIGITIFLCGIFCLKKRRHSYSQEPCGTPRCMVEYHLPRPAHLLERNGSVHSKSLSLDIIGNQNSCDGSNIENDYSRTWQLPDRSHNNHHPNNNPNNHHNNHPNNLNNNPNNPNNNPNNHHNNHPNNLNNNPNNPNNNINNLASIYNTHHNVMTSSFKPLLLDDDRGRNLPPLSDHIYESPNFDRKIYNPPPPPSIPQSPSHHPTISQPLSQHQPIPQSPSQHQPIPPLLKHHPYLSTSPSLQRS